LIAFLDIEQSPIKLDKIVGMILTILFFLHIFNQTAKYNTSYSTPGELTMMKKWQINRDRLITIYTKFHGQTIEEFEANLIRDLKLETAELVLQYQKQEGTNPRTKQPSIKQRLEWETHDFVITTTRYGKIINIRPRDQTQQRRESIPMSKNFKSIKSKVSNRPTARPKLRVIESPVSIKRRVPEPVVKPTVITHRRRRHIELPQK